MARRASEEERGENRKDRLDEDSAGTKTSLLLPRSEKRGRYIGVSLPRPRPLFSPTSRARRISGREGRRRYGRGKGEGGTGRGAGLTEEIELRAQDRI